MGNGLMATSGSGQKHRISILTGSPLCRKCRQYLPKLVHCSENHQVPRADSTSKHKGPRGGCNALVGWCGFLEGTMKLPRREFLRLALGAAALSAASQVALAQAYPRGRYALIAGFPPGGGVDITARLIG